jgi:GTP-dependent phosphoenolpyruvate carboxykinase
MIDSMNTYIKQIAQKKGLYIVDMNMHFSKVKKGFTVDGVHLTASSYKYFNQRMLSALPINCF